MDEKTIKNIKTLGIDMISEAASGHPGVVLGAAPILYTLYNNHINVNKDVPNWINRDRFILSAGHASALLYATLFMSGFDISIEDLKSFRKAYSNTPGHPEVNITSGVDMTTGCLGQGFSSAVGMALAGKIMDAKYFFKNENSDDKIENIESIFDYKVYVLCSDGDLMEGVSYEAASLAGHLKLNNLIVLYDSNSITLDGSTDDTFTENVLDRFETMGWNVQEVKKGNKIADIDKAISRAKGSSKPNIIKINTIIGEGTKNEGTNKVHGKALTSEEVKKLKEKLDMPNIKFFVDEECRTSMTNKIFSRSEKKYQKWLEQADRLVEETFSGDIKKFNSIFDLNGNCSITNKNIDLSVELHEALRDTNHKVLNAFSEYIPNLIVGSADVAESSKVFLDDSGIINSEDYTGQNIAFGVREHAMAAVMNGLALCNFRPFCSTYLSFSDYMKPAIRMSALMNIPVTYVFTHDSFLVGEDGPTHQPIEQLVSLRSIPNFDVYRPADVNELIGCYYEIIDNKKPCALVLSRVKVKLMDSTNAIGVKSGAYIIKNEVKYLHGIIIATGSELEMAYDIANDLYEELGLDLRVVSMPCQSIYLRQDEEYKNYLLPKRVKTIVIEASSSLGWFGFASDENCLITVDRFGISGTSDEVRKYFKFDYLTVKGRIKKLFVQK